MKCTTGVLLLAVLAAGCTGGAGSAGHAGRSASPSATSTSASAPTATPPAGSPSGTPPAGSPSPSAAASPAATASSPADLKLARVLPRASELPAGYTRDTVTRGTALPVSTSDSPCAQRFAALNALRTVGPLAATATARASFSKGATGPFLRTTVRHYAAAAAAGRIITAVDDIFRKCPSFTATNPITHRLTTVTLTPLRFPHLGQQGVAVTGRLSSNGKGVDIDLVFARTAASVAFVAEIATTGVDVTALERALRAEVGRLAAAG